MLWLEWHTIFRSTLNHAFLPKSICRVFSVCFVFNTRLRGSPSGPCLSNFQLLTMFQCKDFQFRLYDTKQTVIYNLIRHCIFDRYWGFIQPFPCQRIDFTTVHSSWRHTEGREPLEWKTWKPADERSSSHQPRSSANLSSCGFWLGSETLGSIRLKIVNNCAQFAHTRAQNTCKSGEKFRSTLPIQWSSKQAGEMRLQSKLDSFCRNLRRGARRPPGCFGRIRGVEFFSRDNRTRRHSPPLRVKLAGQK